MDVPEQKYRKVMSEYRPLFNNLMSQNPIYPYQKQPQSHTRNLKYIATQALLSDNYPYHNPIFTQALQNIKNQLSDPNPQTKSLALRLGRVLPLLHRINLIEMCENQLLAVATSKQKEGFNYQTAADLSQLLLSVFELTCQSEQVYFDVNQRIITTFSRYLDHSLNHDKNNLRNGCQVLRNIFCSLGYSINRTEHLQNKLITKLINIFMPSSSFVNKEIQAQGPTHQNNNKFISIVLRCRQLECRLRVRLLYGFCCLLSHLPRLDCQLLDLLSRQVLEVADNISQCDVLLDCFHSLSVLISQQQPYYTRNQLLRRWLTILEQLSFKKQYLEYYVLLLDLCNNHQVPQKPAYALAIHCLQLCKHLQQQFSRFLIYSRACKIILSISRHTYQSNPDCNLLLRIFQYDWFIDRINQQNQLFKSQFLIALLHHAISLPSQPTPQHLLDLLDISHRLIDWKCTSKEQTHIPTLKFAFDMYIVALGWSCRLLQSKGGSGVERVVEDLINRSNDPSIYFLFKFKLIGGLLQLQWYRQNHKYLQSKLNLQFIQDEVRVVMMPKNPKPIFSYEYSLTYDGQVQSRKQIEYIKIIMDLLGKIPKIHQGYANDIQNIIIDYHRYLNQLEIREEANKELINCLQTLEADSYLSVAQHQFLLAVLPSSPYLKTLNHQTNLEETLLYSTMEVVACDQQINIFGPMSPLQLTIKLHPHPSFGSVYIHVKKNQWVQTQNQLKLVVSSGLQKKQLPFESSILQIKIDRIGALHFQVWKGMDNDLLLGSGSYRIKRNLQWIRVDHLRIVDGIQTKAYFKDVESSQPQSYLSCFYGQPLIIHIFKHQNKAIFGVPNKQIWNQIRDIVPIMLQELISGTAAIRDYNL